MPTMVIGTIKYNSEFMDAEGEQMINWGVWSFTATNETKQLQGALGSLVKKGYAWCDNSEEEESCALTEKGYNYAKEQNILN